jgi:hypothetical protein
MAVQPHLFPPAEPAPQSPAYPTAPAPKVDAQLQPAPIWLQRVSLFILVLFCVYLGAFVVAVPWLPSIWDHNMLFNSFPAVAAFLRLGVVRGIISGLGLLDIWIGISEAIHYRESPVLPPPQQQP